VPARPLRPRSKTRSATVKPLPLALITGGRGAIATQLTAQLEAAGFSVLAPGRDELDVSDPGAVDRYFADRVTAPLDLLVNNAGAIEDARLANMDAVAFARVLDVNLGGAFRCSQRALRPMLKARAGHIVNIGSFSALSGPVGQANYAAAKAGLIALTQSIAREAGARGVRANTVLPGFLETKMTAKVPPEAARRALGAHVLGRFNTPEDAARFIVFLHQHLPHVSGQMFQLDSRIRRWT
jgi:NAD(P)-dependent dehydrogenase (short-subunit alcohol dehydrogenase family)